MQQKKASSLIFVGDPMCSWCYAFGPELRRILADTGLPVRLVMGGLFAGDDAPRLDAALRRYLDTTWTRVAEASGRRIDHRPLEWSDWTYDTEPACRAVVAMRRLRPESALVFFDRIQRWFYACALDVTDPTIYGDLVTEFGVDPDVFIATMASDETRAETAADFEEARRLGAHGFPTVLLDLGREQIVVAPGFVPAARVIRSIAVLSC